jgi:hypothetical protein
VHTSLSFGAQLWAPSIALLERHFSEQTVRVGWDLRIANTTKQSATHDGMHFQGSIIFEGQQEWLGAESDSFKDPRAARKHSGSAKYDRSID